jgi:hypothetical protein
VAHAERRDLYLRPTLITPDYAKEEPGEGTKRPRLTLRYLHELIDDIHVENGKLADQIDTLSNQLDELARKLDALDIWKEDDELAAGLEVRFAYVEPEEPAIAGDADSVVNAAAIAALEAPAAAESHAAAKSIEAAAAIEAEESIETTGITETATASTTAIALQEASDSSEAFAREWALVPLEHSYSASVISPHAAGDLPASLQERMIENVKEAARIAEEIAAQASAHMEARAENEAALPTETPSFESMRRLADPPVEAAGDSASELRLAAYSTDVTSPAEASKPDALSMAPRIRETVFRHVPAPAAHSYIPPRSERHAGTKKRSIWSRLFAR